MDVRISALQSLELSIFVGKLRWSHCYLVYGPIPPPPPPHSPHPAGFLSLTDIIVQSISISLVCISICHIWSTIAASSHNLNLEHITILSIHTQALGVAPMVTSKAQSGRVNGFKVTGFLETKDIFQQLFLICLFLFTRFFPLSLKYSCLLSQIIIIIMKLP